MTTQIIERSAERTTCANCPYFQDFGEPNGRGWCGVFDRMARSHHRQTGDCTLEISRLQQKPVMLDVEAEPVTEQPDKTSETGKELESDTQTRQPQPEVAVQQPKPQLLQQLVEEAFDSVPSSLQPTPLSPTEYEQRRCHGQADAAERQHPIYAKPKSEYAIGYLEGYKSYSSQQQPAPTQPVEWSVTYDPRWQCYQAWVKERCIGHASTHEEAERLAQKYIATDEMIRRQNLKVLAAYAG